jgi:hypothetical protein
VSRRQTPTLLLLLFGIIDIITVIVSFVAPSSPRP